MEDVFVVGDTVVDTVLGEFGRFLDATELFLEGLSASEGGKERAIRETVFHHLTYTIHGLKREQGGRGRDHDSDCSAAGALSAWDVACLSAVQERKVHGGVRV
jgi:hypothetical protein